MNKKCLKCKIIKNERLFYKSKKQILSYCKSCHKESMTSRTKQLYKQIPEKYKEYRRTRNKALRLEVLTNYGNGLIACNCCGESEIKFLGIDHVKGGGSRERKENGGGGRFYFFLKKSGYPKGYQVLCHNCNLAKGFYKKCPHGE